MSGKGGRGFTLSELLVAMVLSLTVMAGLYSFYISGQRVYAIQDQLLETQQNLRIALELLVEDIQGAGGIGIPSAAAVTVANSSTGADLLSLLIPDPTVCPAPNPQVIPILTYNLGQGGGAANMFLDSGSTCAAMDGKVGIVVDASGLNYRTIEITQVTTANDKVNFSPGLSPLNSSGGLGADYTGGTLVLLRQVTYTVDLSDSAKPVLRRDLNQGAGSEPIANYIEDMQVSLGYDRNSDGLIAEVGSIADDDEWVFNVASESNATEAPTNLRSIRIVLVGRTRLQDPQFQGLLPAILDRGAGGTDGYRRRTRGTRVKIRNLGV
ncbi:MAG: PilW family protein [Candidatus Binatia bacterium]